MPKQRVSWPEVASALNLTPKVDLRAAGLWPTAENTPDSFATLRNTREAVLEMLVSLEDHLEMTHPGGRAKRQAVQSVRRRLELELWP